MTDNYCDLIKLIRSIQRQEGHPDCFGKPDGDCSEWDCQWHAYCRKASATPGTSFQLQGEKPPG